MNPRIFMKLSTFALLALTLTPLVCSAGESGKGTMIMLGGISGWLVLSSGFILWKEIKRGKHNRDDK